MSDSLKFPDRDGLWSRKGIEYEARRDSRGMMWVMACDPDPIDGCVAEYMAFAVDPPIAWKWVPLLVLLIRPGPALVLRSIDWLRAFGLVCIFISDSELFHFTR